MAQNYKKILEDSLSKFNKGTHFYGRFYSIISFPFTVLLIKLKFSPNFITLISILLGITGSLFFLKYSLILAIVLYELSVILDYCDGSVALFTKRTSKFGAWFDHIGDRVILGLLVICISIGLFLKYNSYLPLILGFVFLAIKTLRDYNELYVNSVSVYKETTQSAKNELKNKFGFLSTIVEFVLDLLSLLLPFIMLFNFTIIIYFFIICIISESIRISVDLVFTGKKFYK